MHIEIQIYQMVKKYTLSLNTLLMLGLGNNIYSVTFVVVARALSRRLPVIVMF